MTYEAYCASCGLRKVCASAAMAMKVATKHNRGCEVQRPNWKPVVEKMTEVPLEEFQWYPGWEKHWDVVEKEIHRDA